MRWTALSIVLLAACRAPTIAAPDAPSTSEAAAHVRAPEPPDPPPETPAPEPSMTFVGDGWVRAREDPSTPLLRFTTLEPSNATDPTPVRALLDVLSPLMACYEAELATDPELRATVWIRRKEPAPLVEDPELGVDAPHSTALAECVGPVLRTAVSVTADPHGRYALSLYPHHDQAPRLPEPELGDDVIEREGGSCFTKRTYPCKPHKVCMAPDWERTRCHHPADRPGVALRWAFGAASEHRWPIRGLDLVALDGALVWRTHLEPDDADRLGTMHEDEAMAYLGEFRDRVLPGAWLVELEPTQVVLADGAGVRVLDRRTGEPRFRYAVRDPEASRMWFDDGTFTARTAKRRCTGDAHHGAFAVRCGEDILYFDGHVLAVIAMDDAVWLRGETTLDEPSSERTGGSVHPRASLRVARYRVTVEGMVYMQ